MRTLLRCHFTVFQRYIICAFLFVVLLPGCKTQILTDQPLSSVKSSPQDPSVITEIVVNNPLAVQLYVAPRENKQCPLQVRLSLAGRILAIENLDWSAPSSSLYQSNWVGLWHRDGEHGLPAYTLGEEYLSVTTAIDVVETSPGAWAVLVWQSGGFEHVKRTHYLYAIKNHSLVRLWSDTEGEGPYISDLTVVDMPKDHTAVLHIKGMLNESSEAFDEPHITRLYVESNGSVVKQPITTDITAVIAGEHNAIAEARQFIAQRSSCLSNYWVVSGQNINDRVKTKTVVIALQEHEESAEQEIARLQKCAPDLNPRIVTINMPIQE